MGWRERTKVGGKMVYLSDRAENAGRNHYEIVLGWLLAEGLITFKAGTVSKLDIQHDDWCGVFDGAPCNCRPAILIDGEQVGYPADLVGADRR